MNVSGTFPKDRGKADWRDPINDPRNNCGTHFCTSPLNVSLETIRLFYFRCLPRYFLKKKKTIYRLQVRSQELIFKKVKIALYPRIMTKSRILAALVFTWLISIFVPLIQLFWYEPVHGEMPLPNNYLMYDIFCVAIIVLLHLR